MIDHKQNIDHLDHPKPGDYWHEFYMPVLVVVSVSGDDVMICDKTKQVDGDRWTWDLDHGVSITTREEMSRRLRYDTMPDKTWCVVVPQSHRWVVDEVKKLRS